MDHPDVERRLELLWSTFDDHDADDFMAAIERLVAELPDDDPIRPYERASALDSAGHPEPAVAGYRQALDAGLGGPRRRQAVIQLASSLRNLGRAEESVDLLTAELRAGADDLDDAVRAFLALALSSAGRDREAVAVALTALAPHLTRYNRSLAAYARELA